MSKSSYMEAKLEYSGHNAMYNDSELQEILNHLLSLPAEIETVEFKHAENDYSEQKLGEYFSALSNEANLHGNAEAWLVFGIDNDTHQVVGTNYKPSRPSLDEMKKKIADQTTNRITFDEIYELERDGKRVIMFDIPAAPQGMPIAYKGFYYGRDGESLVALNIVEIEKIRAQVVKKESFETVIARDNLTATEVLELLDYDKMYEVLKKRTPREDNVILELMKEYGLIIQKGDMYAITNMGALLFARKLRDFDSVAHRDIFLRRYEGVNNLILLEEKRSVAGYVIEFDAMVDWLELHSSKEKIVILREREVTYPKVAIREFLANMMVHQDFTIIGMPLTVEIYSNRIIFTNPGASLNDVNRLIDLPAHSRNEKLADTLIIFDMGERRGSGYDRAVAGIEAMQLPGYHTESGDKYTRVTMFPKKNVNDMSKQERIQTCYQHVCLLYENREQVNNTSVRERFGLDAHKTAMVSHILSDTMNAGLIKVEDPVSESRRYASYVPYYS